MSADLSRVRFDPLLDFSGVILQQGRLLLDGDFNELVAILDRRLRAETVDLTSFGPDPDHAGSSWVPRQTADGFRISVSGGELVIGQGRMYVDGLLAENHGVLPLEFDGLLAESRGSDDTPYLDQPWWPTPEPLPEAGAHLVYLDVWQREVTHIEDPGLVEVAVGVDTTARSQTVWQVRLHPVAAGGPSVTCATPDADIPGWADLIEPSAGRLTVSTIPVDDDTDPCELPPTGGFRGLENQTYRIQIHDGGEPGTATFKFSRENASVVLPAVEMIDVNTLRLASLGKDEVLRIDTGDWVEIIDDNVELDGGQGAIRRVTVDDAARTITFSPALPTELRPTDSADAVARHLRVTRWDQAGLVVTASGATVVDLDDGGATGVIPVPANDATQVVLEDGIVVSFSAARAGGVFRPGDHWIVAARTADTSIDELTDEPPLGVHHHYARLGIVAFPNSVTDCRRLWPPVATGGGESCDCTVCVDPESHSSGQLTLQAAVDTVRTSGGTICLHTGVYDIGPGIDLEGARSVRIHGQGMATILIARGEALRINRASGLQIDHLALISGVAANEAISIRSTTLSSFEHLVVIALGNTDRRGAAIRLSGVALGLDIRHCILAGSPGIGVGTPGSDVTIGILGGALRIEDNLVIGTAGIDLGGISAYAASVHVTRNDVLGGTGGGIRASGATLPGGAVHISDNVVWSNGPAITIGADGIVDGNTVSGLRAAVDQIGDGIVADTGFPAQPGHVRVTGNRIRNRGGTGIVLRTRVESWMVKQNVVEGAGGGIGVEAKGSAAVASVENNHVSDIAVARGELSVAGIDVSGVEAVTVAGNTVRRVGLELVDGRVRSGIAVTGAATVAVNGNVVAHIGPVEYVGIVAGIYVTAPFDHATVAGNEVTYRPGEPPNTPWYAVLIQAPFSVFVAKSHLKAVLPLSTGALVLSKFWAQAVPQRPQHVTFSGNATTSDGGREGVHIAVQGDVVADGNQLDHDRARIALRIGGAALTVSTNRVRGTESTIVLEPANEIAFAAVGNLAPGGTHLFGPGNGLPDPWAPLNPAV